MAIVPPETRRVELSHLVGTLPRRMRTADRESSYPSTLRTNGGSDPFSLAFRGRAIKPA